VATILIYTPKKYGGTTQGVPATSKSRGVCTLSTQGSMRMCAVTNFGQLINLFIYLLIYSFSQSARTTSITGVV